jgi:malate dehydrogenase (oxaloacetate-decarboxylating)
MNIREEAIKLHQKLKGKLEIKSKIHVKERKDLNLAYTPGVAEACKEIVNDITRIYELTIKNNSVAIVTDGSAVLGLGNIGAEAALPVMEGKSILFKEFANIDAFPICLKTQNSKEIVNIIKNITPVFGGINLEDISAPRCFDIEEKLGDIGIPVFHDDQHGTAIVVLAALINSLKVVNKKDINIIINGAGAAGIAITKILLNYNETNDNFRINDIILCDSKGIIYDGRDDLNEIKKQISKITNKDKIKGNLEFAIKNKDVFIGVSVGSIVTEKMIRSMNKSAIVFAMANPIPEIMPDKALNAGAKVIATGRSDFSNQINNVLAFPGVFRGLLDSKAKRVTNKMKIAAAKALADYVKDVDENNIIPSALDKNVSKIVADAIIKAQ